MAKHNRYREFEKLMTLMLLTATGLFIVYLVVAIAGIFWLKIVLGILNILLSAAGLYLLYSSQELLKQRSLWISCGFLASLLCTAVSLILNFP